MWPEAPDAARCTGLIVANVGVTAGICQARGWACRQARGWDCRQARGWA